MAVIDLVSFFRNRKESSANSKCVRGWVDLPIFMPFRLWRVSCLSRAQERMFAHRRKRYGDSGSPCLSLLLGLKVAVGLALGVSYRKLFEHIGRPK
jgi:hypothetical protein